MPTKEGWIPEAWLMAVTENGTLKEDAVCKSPSTAGWIVLGHANNGWFVWKNKNGNPIDVYRQQ